MKRVKQPKPELVKNMSKNLKYLSYYGSYQKGNYFVKNFLTVLRYVCSEENVKNREEKFATLEVVFNKYLVAFSYRYCNDYTIYTKIGTVPTSIENRFAKLAEKIEEIKKAKKEQEDKKIEQKEIKEDASVGKICEQLDEFSL